MIKSSLITVGIDASNIRAGGGLKHLIEILSNARPESFGVGRVIVWVCPSVSDYFPVVPWLEVVTVAWFEKSIFHRMIWRITRLREIMNQSCDVAFFPGGISLNLAIPSVVMSQNMQPFMKAERQAEGLSKARLRVELLRFLQGWSFQKATGRIFLTEYVKREIKKQFCFSENNTRVIPHGIDQAFFSDKSSDADPEKNGFRILYVSTLNTYKHQIEVIDAVDVLLSKGFDVSITLVGDKVSPYGDKVIEKIRSINDKYGKEVAVYSGKVPFDELPLIYRSSDIFVFASSCENLPNILLEAMGASLPIVCSDVEPMPSVLGNAGLYCDVRNPSSIAEKIELYIKSSKLRDDAGKAGNSSSKEYSWRAASDQTFEFLASIALGH